MTDLQLFALAQILIAPDGYTTVTAFRAVQAFISSINKCKFIGIIHCFMSLMS
jgi:hypothetical protein